MKILQLVMTGNPCPAIFGGAVQQTVDELSKKHQAMNNDVIVLSTIKKKDISKMKNVDGNGVIYDYVVTNKTNIKKLNFVIVVKHLLAARKRSKYDIVHTHSPIAAVLFYSFRFLMGRPKIVCHIHNRSKYLFLLKKLSIASVGVSESVLQLDKYKFKKYSVIHNICRNEIFPFVNNPDREKLKTKFELTEGQYTILFVGRLSKEKGLTVLLDAVSKIPKEISKKITIMVAGGSWFKGSSKTQYQIDVEESGKNLDIRWLGYVDNWILKDLYGAADVFIFPSIWEEPAGQVLLEAQSCGTKVIASHIGGIPEYLSPFEQTFSAGDSSQLKEMILMDMNSTDDFREERSKWVQENFASDKISKEWIKLYSSVIGD